MKCPLCQQKIDTYIAANVCRKCESQAVLRVVNGTLITDGCRCSSCNDLDKFVYVVKWIPCSERLPEPETNVLIYSTLDKRIMTAQIWLQGWNTLDDWGLRLQDVTHWMPLPAPPDSTKECSTVER
jgi:hypothetical protein